METQSFICSLSGKQVPEFTFTYVNVNFVFDYSSLLNEIKKT